jgi:hypothetical protein
MTVSNATFLGANVFLGGLRSVGQLVINNGSVTLSGQLNIGSGEQSSGSVSLDGGQLFVTNGATRIGVGTPSSANSLTVSNGLFLARDVYVGAFQSSGTLSINGGTSILSSNLQIGVGNSEATVSITDGQLLVTNAPIVVDDAAQCTISGGRLAARTIELGISAKGTLMVDGGSVTASEGITLGDCNNDSAVGYVWVSAGQLIVTNASGSGFIDIQNGQLILSNGVVQVDKLVMTNSCGQLIHVGGTLIVGSLVLGPNAPRITSIVRQGNDMNISWILGPGQTNALQATSGAADGSYSANGFTDIFVVTNNISPGVVTNFVDIGGATNRPSRYYRARLGL